MAGRLTPRRPTTDIAAPGDATWWAPRSDGYMSPAAAPSRGTCWTAWHRRPAEAAWALDGMFGTTDSPSYWRRIFGDPVTQPERYADNSPNLRAGQISTPMLVIHGDKDYRVPVGEALRLWWDVRGRVPGARFLYFPDENHWILSPGNAAIWYETVLAFLAQHVLGEEWRRPGLL